MQSVVTDYSLCARVHVAKRRKHCHIFKIETSARSLVDVSLRYGVWQMMRHENALLETGATGSASDQT